jgi:hypothetical protein
MSYGIRILAGDESHHPESDVLRRIGARLAILHHVEALSLQTEVDVLSRDKRAESNVQPAEIFALGGLQLDNLCVDLKH